ncbi:MAG: WG repeat-containing protein [Emticicia sp.]|nr:WG repeat-containing protein [Emticicia sp.]
MAKEITPFIYDEIRYFGDEIKKRAASKAGKWGGGGTIDNAGKTIIPFEYQDISHISTIIQAQRSNRWGVVDEKNQVIIPFIYDGMGFVGENLIPVQKGLKWGYVNTSGKIIIPFVYDEANPFSGEVASVTLKGKYITIDKSGKCTNECD